MANELTQGSIITNIRSPKYKGIRCYGIVISARCDIAQDKAESIHVISGVPLSAWIQTVVFQKAVSSLIKKQIEKIEKWADSVNLDKDVLISLGPEKALLNIKESSSGNKADALQACNFWSQYLEYCIDDVPIEKIVTFLNNEGKSQRKDMLQNLFRGELTHYGFIPEDAYLGNNNTRDGLVADYHDILVLSRDQIKCIQRRDYDYWKISETNQLSIANTSFVLERPEDVVMIAYEINSPWIEKVMQGFAFSFIRVGVDSISSEDAKRLSKQDLIHNDDQLIWKGE